MSTVQVTDGSSAVTDSSTKNDGGAVVKGGNPASDSPITKNLNLNELDTMGTVNEYGSKVVSQDGTTGDLAGVTTAKSAGTGGLAYNVDPRAGDRNFIILQAGDSAGKINNDASTVLTIPNSEYGLEGERETIKPVINTRRHGADSDRAFDVLAVPSTAMVPGRTKGTGAGNASTFVNPADGTAAVSTEIKPTRAVPGELTYHFGGLAKPSTDEYKAKDSNE
jgi:hypothetical protein